MTRKLYETDSYLLEFEGRVIACEPQDNLFAIELDKTAFFPNQGGQSCDKGMLNGMDVLNVEITGDRILHFTGSPIEPGTMVTGKIDYDHRFRNMQMHSGEHIFSGLVYKMYGFSNVGFHLSDNSATMDFNGKLTAEQVSEIERRVNSAIFENHCIRAYIPSADELAVTDYRSKKELEGDVRLVEVEGIDICACCAPHVSRTGEIGLFKVVNLQNYKSGVRIDYLCGLRALEYFKQCTDCIGEISKLLSAKPGTELVAVKSLYDENKNLQAALNEERKKSVENRVSGASLSGGFYVLFIGTELSGLLKYTVEAMHNRYGSEIAVFAVCDGGFKYLIESSQKDLTLLTNAFRERFSAKGGGRKDSIQGSVTAEAAELLETITAIYK